MFQVVVFAFAASVVAPFLVPRLGRGAGWAMGAVPAAIFVWTLVQAPAVLDGGVLYQSIAWVPSLGIRLEFRLDGLSLLFALLVAGVGTIVMVYARSYLGDHPHIGRFYLYLTSFMAAMLGLVLADDLIALFVFWELTSLTSYLLIGFEATEESSRKAALKALLITGGGGLALLAGLILIGAMAGTTSISAVIRTTGFAGHALYPAALLLVAFGAFTKSAQFPFHIWLPGAMAAPTPVSAYLHSATMVKAGIYLLARLNPALGGTALWTGLLTAVGGATLLVAGGLALWQRDLKRLLAYSTVSALGTMVLLLGVDTVTSIRAMLVVLLSHAFYKGALFLVAGIVDHETGTRDVTRLGGLFKRMPVTAGAGLVAGLSMAGLPPLLGFVGKELFYEATLYGGGTALLLTIVAVAGNAMTVAVAGILMVDTFFGPPSEASRSAHDPGRSLYLGPVLLGASGLIAEIVPGFSSAALLRPASSAILGVPDTMVLKIWHGFTPMLGLTVLTIMAGGLIFWARRRIRRAADRHAGLTRLGADAAYDRGLDGMLAAARWQTRRLQTGSLRHYVSFVLMTLLVLVGYAMFARWDPAIRLETPSPGVLEGVVGAMILVAAAATVRSRSRLAAVALLGAVGFGIALVFLLFSGPDLAVTQLAVETLAVLLFVFVLYRLPRFSRFSGRAQRIWDGLLALAVGGLMTALVLAVVAENRLSRLAPYFASTSVPEGRGRNVVNVILVDFRALDTLGEIAVLAISAVGVFALLRLRPSEEVGR